MGRCGSDTWLLKSHSLKAETFKVLRLWWKFLDYDEKVMKSKSMRPRAASPNAYSLPEPHRTWLYYVCISRDDKVPFSQQPISYPFYNLIQGQTVFFLDLCNHDLPWEVSFITKQFKNQFLSSNTEALVSSTGWYVFVMEGPRCSSWEQASHCYQSWLLINMKKKTPGA